MRLRVLRFTLVFFSARQLDQVQCALNSCIDTPN